MYQWQHMKSAFYSGLMKVCSFDRLMYVIIMLSLDCVSTWMGDRLAICKELIWHAILYCIRCVKLIYECFCLCGCPYNSGYSRKFDIGINQKLPLNREVSRRKFQISGEVSRSWRYCNARPTRDRAGASSWTLSPYKNQFNIEEDTWSSYQILSW